MAADSGQFFPERRRACPRLLRTAARLEWGEASMTSLRMADCINSSCPWSGKPVQPDSLTMYGGHVVGFCNPGCRDKFERAIRHFEENQAAQAKLMPH